MCSVTANPPASIVWFKISDEEIEELTNTSKIAITHQFTSDVAPISFSTLIINATGSSDYMCIADNNIGDAVSSNFSLVKTGHCNCIRTYKGNKCLVEGTCVYAFITHCISIMIGQGSEVLVFITKPRNQTAVNGSSVEFQCSACSTLEPTIMWTFTRKGSMISEVIDENSTFVDITVRVNSLALTINNVNWTYEGVYQCIIFTENNHIEAEAGLNVLSKLFTVRNSLLI